MRRRARRSFRRGKSNYVWTSLVFTGQANVGTGIVVAALVDGNDWARVADNVSLERGAVLERIVGYLAPFADVVRSEATDFIGSMVRLAIIHDTELGFNNAVAGVGDLDLAATYVENDILWTHGWGFGGAQNTDAPAQAFAFPPSTQVDIRVKRKLTSDSVIYTVIQADQVAGYGKRIGGVLRALVRIP